MHFFYKLLGLKCGLKLTTDGYFGIFFPPSALYRSKLSSNIVRTSVLAILSTEPGISFVTRTTIFYTPDSLHSALPAKHWK